MMRQAKNSREDPARPTVLTDALARARKLLETYLAEHSALGDRLQSLRARLAQERFQLAVLGQFKRGKSTFINAVLGAPVLPTAVIPLTAVAVFIAWGVEPFARVMFKTGRPAEECHSRDAQALQQFLARFVAEEQNPKNHLAVARVELFYPAPILSNGTVLIDTPGFGSSHQHNTKAAIQVLPECDAALFIVSADPPITEIELSYLERVKRKMACLFFVLNKLDYLDDHERQVAIDFLRKVLSEQLLLEPSAPIFGVSARDALAAKRANRRDALEKSGMAMIEEHLLGYLAAEKRRSLEQAIHGKAMDVLSEAIGEAKMRRQALKMPISMLTAKATAFDEALRAIEQQRLVTRDLIAGNKRRLVSHLESRIRELREETSAQLAAAVEENLAGDIPNTWQQKAQDAAAAAIQQLFETARKRLVNEFTAAVAKALVVHQKRFNKLTDSVRRTAAELFDVALGPQHGRETFELGHDPYWVTENINVRLLPDPGRLLDRFAPLRVRRSRLHGRIMQRVNDLIVRNAENLRWAILRGLDDTMRQAAGRLEERLDEGMVATKGVITDALEQRRERASATEADITKLDRFVAELDTIREMLMSERYNEASGRDGKLALEPAASSK